MAMTRLRILKTTTRLVAQGRKEQSAWEVFLETCFKAIQIKRSALRSYHKSSKETITKVQVMHSEASSSDTISRMTQFYIYKYTTHQFFIV